MNKVKHVTAKSEEMVAAPKIFGEYSQPALVAQAVHVYRELAHAGTAKAKTRAEINRTKKKWFKQKGTGNARHGARSAPIFVGGGATHGPVPVNHAIALSKKMARKALLASLSFKATHGTVVLIDMPTLSKTKDAAALVARIQTKKTDRVLLVVANPTNVKSVFRNIPEVGIIAYSNLNAYHVVTAGVVAFEASLFAAKEKKEPTAKKAEAKKAVVKKTVKKEKTK